MFLFLYKKNLIDRNRRKGEMKRKFGGRGNRFWRMGRRERRNVECSPSL